MGGGGMAKHADAPQRRRWAAGRPFNRESGRGLRAGRYRLRLAGLGLSGAVASPPSAQESDSPHASFRTTMRSYEGPDTYISTRVSLVSSGHVVMWNAGCSVSITRSRRLQALCAPVRS